MKGKAHLEPLASAHTVCDIHGSLSIPTQPFIDYVNLCLSYSFLSSRDSNGTCFTGLLKGITERITKKYYIVLAR